MGRILDSLSVLIGRKAVSTPTDVDTSGAFGAWLQRVSAGLNVGRSGKTFYDMMNNYTSYVYACASRNATAAAKVPLRLYVVKPTRASRMSARCVSVPVNRDKNLRSRASLHKWMSKAEGGAVEEIVEHPLLTLLEAANDIEDQFTLQELTHICLEMTGNGYWYLDKNGLGLPEQIIPMLPQYVTALTTKGQDLITGYRYTRGMKKSDYSIDDIIHFRYPNPTSRVYGLGKYPAASEAADILAGQNDYELSLLNNQGRPDTILSAKGTITPEEKGRMAKAWKKAFGGASKAGGVFVAEGGLEPKAMGYPPRDMAPFQSRKLSREEIAAVFGVPLSKLTTDAVNLANAEAGNYSHLADTVSPMLLRHEQALNARLTPLYGPNLFLAYDNCVPENLAFKLTERESNITSGYASINEERGIEGRELVEWGDEPILSTSVAPISMLSLEPEPTVPIPEPEPIPPKDITPDRTKSIARSNDDFAWRQPYVRRMNRIVREYFADMERSVLRLLRKSKAVEDVQGMATFGLNQWNERFQHDIGPIYKGIAEASGKRQMRRLPAAGVTFDVESEDLTRFFDETLPKLANGINEKTANDLNEALRAGMAEGETLRDLSKRIKTVFNNKQAWESDRIARTETCRAQMFATEQSMIQSGVVKAKIWSAAGDPCPWCSEMEGRTMALGEPYFTEFDSMNVETVGAGGEPKTQTLSFEFGAVDGPPLHPNCRCTLIEVMK